MRVLGVSVSTGDLFVGGLLQLGANQFLIGFFWPAEAHRFGNLRALWVEGDGWIAITDLTCREHALLFGRSGR